MSRHDATGRTFTNASRIANPSRNFTSTRKRDNLTMKCLQLFIDRKAVTAIEYGLIAALIAVVIITAITSLGHGVSLTFNHVASEL
jgi:pilus assembly protein Flp/PilA